MKTKARRVASIIVIIIALAALIKIFVSEQGAYSEVGEALPAQGFHSDQKKSIHNSITEALSQKTLSAVESTRVLSLSEVTIEFERCFETKILGDDSPLNMENIVATLKPILGEPDGISQDWSNTILMNAQGEERRVRLELEAIGDEGVQRVMKLYGVDEEGLPVPLEIPAEHQLNPSDALVASYQSDGQLKLQESGLRASYRNGHEIFAIERNGRLSEVEFSYDNRYLTCRDVGKEKLDCQCAK